MRRSGVSFWKIPLIPFTSAGLIQERAGRAYRRVYTFVSKPEGWLRTNALSAEPVFDVVFSAAIGGTVRRKDK